MAMPKLGLVIVFALLVVASGHVNHKRLSPQHHKVQHHQQPHQKAQQQKPHHKVQQHHNELQDLEDSGKTEAQEIAEVSEVNVWEDQETQEQVFGAVFRTHDLNERCGFFTPLVNYVRGCMSRTPLAEMQALTGGHTLVELPASFHPMLLRMMWLGSTYGYDKTRHYTPQGGDIEQYENIKMLTRKLTHGDAHDAQVALITPQASLTLPVPESESGESMNPSVWWCTYKGFTNCATANIRHLTFRGMQLSLGWRAATIADMQTMRFETAIADCSIVIPLTKDVTRVDVFNTETRKYESSQCDPSTPKCIFLTAIAGLTQIEVSIPRITQGSCVMVNALIQHKSFNPKFQVWKNPRYRTGLVSAVLQELELGNAETHQNKENYIFFHGLSFGGAQAQAALAVFNAFFTNIDVATVLAAHFVEVKLGAVLFGTPRIGEAAFADSLADIQGAIDSFAMYSHFAENRLSYDPVAMWPQNLVALGNKHTIVYHRTSTTTPRVVIRKDMDYSGSSLGFVPGSVSGSTPATRRAVAPLDRKGFKCLHWFTVYLKAMEGQDVPSIWDDAHCNPYQVADKKFE